MAREKRILRGSLLAKSLEFHKLKYRESNLCPEKKPT